MLGATPWKQQLMLAVGGVSSALVMAPVLSLLALAVVAMLLHRLAIRQDTSPAV